MRSKQKILNFLGLAMRAGKVVSGEELVLEAIRSKKKPLVFLAKNAGANTFKKVNDKANFYGSSVVVLFTSEELSQAIGKNRKVIAVVDEGFSKRLDELVSEVE